MLVDACAVLAILLGEPEASAYAAELEAAKEPWTTPLAVFEAILVLARPANRDLDFRQAQTAVLDFLARNAIALRQPGPPEELLGHAVEAAQRYGVSRRKLSTLDCFHYAAAKTAGSPMLTLDKLLRATDIATLP